MSFGVPVIGFDIGTRGNFIEDGVNGFLCDRENFKEKIEYSLDFKDYEDLSDNAILTAKKFENDYVINMQIDIYKNILDSK